LEKEKKRKKVKRKMMKSRKGKVPVFIKLRDEVGGNHFFACDLDVETFNIFQLFFQKAIDSHHGTFNINVEDKYAEPIMMRIFDTFTILQPGEILLIEKLFGEWPYCSYLRTSVDDMIEAIKNQIIRSVEDDEYFKDYNLENNERTELKRKQKEEKVSIFIDLEDEYGKEYWFGCDLDQKTFKDFYKFYNKHKDSDISYAGQFLDMDMKSFRVMETNEVETVRKYFEWPHFPHSGHEEKDVVQLIRDALKEDEDEEYETCK
jgi:hypothetical protein